jgi:hypothetical protein
MAEEPLDLALATFDRIRRQIDYRCITSMEAAITALEALEAAPGEALIPSLINNLIESLELSLVVEEGYRRTSASRASTGSGEEHC